ncbi:hypothetical protein [Legionella cherrii]|uniref:hypothetical protein n=1 Tax=Legionella cherrii TaxID=28084 RepID=UPI000A61886A|nr:hypothetical protein [Legionella cherrii]
MDIVQHNHSLIPSDLCSTVFDVGWALAQQKLHHAFTFKERKYSAKAQPILIEL